MRRTDIKLILFVAVLTSLALLLIFSCTAPDDPVDNEAPTVTLTNPVDGAMAPNAIDVRAEASDNVEVTKVDFYVDGVLYSTDESYPYAGYWTAAVDEAGQHSFSARAFDAEGNNATSTTVTVDCAIIPPAPITDLAITDPDVAGNATLSWTASGDDGSTGTAAEYDVRYFWIEITEDNWSSAVPLDGEPDPQVAGSAESFDVSGMSLSNTYYFAMRTMDAAGNQSDISNCVTVTTQDLFDEQVTLPVNPDLTDMMIDDIDDDGNLDLVFSVSGLSANIEIMYGLGDGTFESAVTYDGNANPTSVGTGDFDDDGELDLAVGNGDFDNTVIYDITCRPDSTFDTVWIAYGVEIDYIDTLVSKVCDSVYVENVSLLTLLYNQGSRSFATVDLGYGFYDTSYYYCDSVIYVPIEPPICLACFDNVYSSTPKYEPSPICPEMDILAFDSTALKQCVWAGPVSIVTGKFDDNLSIDLAVACGQNNIATVLFNNGGGLDNPVDTLLGGGGTCAIACGDLSGDGIDDLVITASNINRLTVFINDGTGNFEDYDNYTVNSYPSRALLADADDDGDLDIFFTSRNSNLVCILTNRGDGTFYNVSEDFTAGQGPSDVAAADLDGDDAIDLAVANRNGNNVYFFPHQGQFKYYSFNTVIFDVGMAPSRIFAKDFDKDGDIDLAVLNDDSNDISFLFNRTIM